MDDKATATSVKTENHVYKVPGSHEYKGIVYLPIFPVSVLEKIRDDLELTSQDIILATYPKCGTTWMQEVLSIICAGGNTTAMQQTPLDDRFPFLEMCLPGKISEYDVIQNRDPPRLIKTHLSAEFFQRQLAMGAEGPKIVVGLRNPKDSLVSMYHFYRMCAVFGNFPGTWDEFFEIFRHNKLMYGNLLDFALTWYKYRDHSNVMFLHYEDMQKNFDKVVQDLGAFLNKPVDEKVVEAVQKFALFDTMKKQVVHTKIAHMMNEKISPFMRNGRVGDWRNYFNKEQNDYMDRYMEKCQGTNLSFSFT